MTSILTDEMIRLIPQVDISDPEKLARFKEWQFNDGSIAGLRELINADRETRMIKDNRDIVVTINHGVDEYDIQFIRDIEAEIDKALRPMGFSRGSRSTSGDSAEIVYYQFAVAL